jgi:hypothetical protein
VFSIVWAVGSILGVTRKVDMKFTKEHNIARFMVAVINSDFIPEYVEVLIGEIMYTDLSSVSRPKWMLSITYQLTWTLIPKKTVMVKNSKKESKEDRENSGNQFTNN